MVIFAQYGLIFLLSAFLVFHLLIITKIIPYTIVWGGRLKSDKEMYRSETVSVVINLFFLFVILVHAGLLSFSFPHWLPITVLWVMVGLFTLNTFGNILSKNKWEKRLFTPVTILLVVFSLLLALS